MRIKNYSELRKDLSRTMDEVLQDHVPVIITRGSKKPVIMMSLEDFSGYEETLYLMKSSANHARLLESVGNFKSGNYEKHDLIEE